MTHWILLILAMFISGGSLRMVNAAGYSSGGIGFFVVASILYIIFILIYNKYFTKGVANNNNVKNDTIIGDN